MHEPLTEVCLWSSWRKYILIHLTWCVRCLIAVPQLHTYLLPSILYGWVLLTTNSIPQTPPGAGFLLNSSKRKRHYFLLILFCFWCFWKQLQPVRDLSSCCNCPSLVVHVLARETILCSPRTGDMEPLETRSWAFITISVPFCFPSPQNY